MTEGLPRGSRRVLDATSDSPPWKTLSTRDQREEAVTRRSKCYFRNTCATCVLRMCLDTRAAHGT